MSVLVVLIPPRPRPKTRDGLPPPAATEWSWLLSTDGQTVAQQGRGAPADWPAADSCVAVLSPTDLAWLPATLPKAPAARLRQALLGVLEDQLLDDETALHFAVAPDAAAGQPTWVAVLHKPWLAEWLQRFEAAGRPIERVLPLGVPGGAPAGHFEPDPQGDGERLQLSWSDSSGALCLALDGSLARSRTATEGAAWTATPSAAAAAEAWLGRPVDVVGEAERALAAARSGWNLMQFDLAPRHRGATALREGWHRFLSPAWRPVHVGLVALLVLNLVGLNAWAWTQQQALSERRQAMVSLLQSTHPQVRAVLDARRQMTRETEQLRAAAGQPGDNDLETLLGVAAAAWPEGEPPVAALQFEPGRLVLGVEGWDDGMVAEFRNQLAPAGWQVTVNGTQLTLSRTPAEGKQP
ncbi:MAG: general secretion pathway protein GspL [Rubrivivax sp.]|nr:general secretion pathway protein GspL [Rubrivivax sp.]